MSQIPFDPTALRAPADRLPPTNRGGSDDSAGFNSYLDRAQAPQRPEAPESRRNEPAQPPVETRDSESSAANDSTADENQNPTTSRDKAEDSTVTESGPTDQSPQEEKESPQDVVEISTNGSPQASVGCVAGPEYCHEQPPAESADASPTGKELAEQEESTQVGKELTKVAEEAPEATLLKSSADETSTAASNEDPAPEAQHGQAEAPDAAKNGSLIAHPQSAAKADQARPSTDSSNLESPKTTPPEATDAGGEQASTQSDSRQSAREEPPSPRAPASAIPKSEPDAEGMQPATASIETKSTAEDDSAEPIQSKAPAASSSPTDAEPDSTPSPSRPAADDGNGASRVNTRGLNGASKSTEPGPADGPSRVQFVQRVARAFQATGDKGGEVRLRLSPPELGSLRVEITVERGVMTARLEAETQQARTLLLDTLPAMRERLATQDIKVARFDIDLMDHDASNPSDSRWDERDPPRHPRSATGTKNSNSTTNGPTRPHTTPVAGDGALNVVI